MIVEVGMLVANCLFSLTKTLVQIFQGVQNLTLRDFIFLFRYAFTFLPEAMSIYDYKYNDSKLRSSMT